VAELLIRRGRLSGSPSALAPTIAAAVRADGLRRGPQGARFRLVDGRLALAEWYLPNEAARLERDAKRAAVSQRDVVHRAFLRKLNELPAGGFVELMATWLNAEGIAALRAVRRPGTSGVELHLAGSLRRGQEEVRVAILVLRDGRDLRAERIIEIRGALHHYATASTAWVITTGRAEPRTREEVEVAGAPPVVLFDGRGLASAMEMRGVGLRPRSLPLASVDLELLDALRGRPEELFREVERDFDDEEGGRGRRKRRRRGRRDREVVAAENGDEEEEIAEEIEEEDEEATEEGEAAQAQEPEPEEGEHRRRRRRRGRRRRGREEVAEGAGEQAQAASGGEQAFEEEAEEEDVEEAEAELPEEEEEERELSEEDEEREPLPWSEEEEDEDEVAWEEREASEDEEPFDDEEDEDEEPAAE
jgi:hypothetical protein